MTLSNFLPRCGARREAGARRAGAAVRGACHVAGAHYNYLTLVIYPGAAHIVKLVSAEPTRLCAGPVTSLAHILVT